jgi:hypothetical protein
MRWTVGAKIGAGFSVALAISAKQTEAAAQNLKGLGQKLHQTVAGYKLSSNSNEEDQS